MFKKFSEIWIKASQIDRYARIVFPSVLGFFHLMYWTYYLSISSLERDSQDT